MSRSVRRWPRTPTTWSSRRRSARCPDPDGVPSGQATPDQLRGLVETDLRYPRARPARPGLSAGRRDDRARRRVDRRPVRGARRAARGGADPAPGHQQRRRRPVRGGPYDRARHGGAEPSTAATARCSRSARRRASPTCRTSRSAVAAPRSTPNGSARSRPAGAPPTAQVAIAALLATSPSVLAIPGTGTLAHLEENVAAGDIDLGDEDLSELRG